jgi:hypothetical protein
VTCTAGEIATPATTFDGSTVKASFVAVPGSTMKSPEAFPVETAPCVAEIVLADPAVIGVIEIPSTRPPDEMTAFTVPVKIFEANTTVPV